MLRRVPPAVRDPLPVRRLPPGVRAGVQRRARWRTRLRDVPRPADLLVAGDPRRADPAGDHRGPRDGPPVVRQHRHAEVVGRPLAQRVVRRVHGQPGDRRRHGVRRRLDAQRLRASAVGADRRPAAEHPPGRRQRRVRRVGRAPGLRRHLLRQGLEHPQAAQHPARRRGVLRGRHRPLHDAPVRQRHHARPVRELGEGGRGRPVRVHRQLAAHRRAGHDRARPGRGRRAPHSPGGPPGRPRPHRPGRDRVAADGKWEVRRCRCRDAETPFPRRTVPRSCSTPTRTAWGAGPAGPGHGGRAEGAACPRPTTPGCGPGSGTTCAARSTTPPWTRPTCSTCSRPASRSEDNDDAIFALMPWATNKVAPLSADPDAALGGSMPRRWRRCTPAPAGSTLQLSAFQAAVSSAQDAGELRGWLAGDGPARRDRPRPRPALAGPGPAGGARRDRPRPAAGGARRRADRGVPRRALAGDGLAARRRGQGVGLAAVHRRGGRAQLRARGGRPGHVAARPDGA